MPISTNEKYAKNYKEIQELANHTTDKSANFYKLLSLTIQLLNTVDNDTQGRYPAIAMIRNKLAHEGMFARVGDLTDLITFLNSWEYTDPKEYPTISTTAIYQTLYPKRSRTSSFYEERLEELNRSPSSSYYGSSSSILQNAINYRYANELITLMTLLLDPSVSHDLKAYNACRAMFIEACSHLSKNTAGKEVLNILGLTDESVKVMLKIGRNSLLHQEFTANQDTYISLPTGVSNDNLSKLKKYRDELGYHDPVANILLTLNPHIKEPEAIRIPRAPIQSSTPTIPPTSETNSKEKETSTLGKQKNKKRKKPTDNSSSQEHLPKPEKSLLQSRPYRERMSMTFFSSTQSSRFTSKQQMKPLAQEEIEQVNEICDAILSAKNRTNLGVLSALQAVFRVAESEMKRLPRDNRLSEEMSSLLKKFEKTQKLMSSMNNYAIMNKAVQIRQYCENIEKELKSNSQSDKEKIEQNLIWAEFQADYIGKQLKDGVRLTPQIKEYVETTLETFDSIKQSIQLRKLDSRVEKTPSLPLTKAPPSSDDFFSDSEIEREERRNNDRIVREAEERADRQKDKIFLRGHITGAVNSAIECYKSAIQHKNSAGKSFFNIAKQAREGFQKMFETYNQNYGEWSELDEKIKEMNALHQTSTKMFAPPPFSSNFTMPL